MPLPYIWCPDCANPSLDTRTRICIYCGYDDRIGTNPYGQSIPKPSALDYFCDHCGIAVHGVLDRYIYATMTTTVFLCGNCYNRITGGAEMVYIHYEHIQLKITGISMTRLVFSTSAQKYDKSFSKIAWGDTEKIIDVIKQIPALERVYDPNSRIWTLYTEKFDLLAKMFSPLQNMYEFIPRPNLEEFVTGVSVFEENKPPKAEDFFYNKEQPITSDTILLPMLEMKLTKLLKVDRLSFDTFSMQEKTKIYKMAAMRLHPDKNNGDGSRMSELNMLWQQYKKMQGA